MQLQAAMNWGAGEAGVEWKMYGVGGNKSLQ